MKLLKNFRLLHRKRGSLKEFRIFSLRHANLKVAMGRYVQAMSDEKRKAQSKVVEIILPGTRKAARYLNGRYWAHLNGSDFYLVKSTP